MASLWDLHSGSSRSPAARREQPGLVLPALTTGFGELVSMAGSGVEALGRGFGVAPVERLGDTIASTGSGIADRNRRSDLETAPWREGGAPVASWLGYQTLKQLPQLGAFLAGSRFVPASATPAALVRAGTAAPRVLGGGGLRGARAAAATEAEVAAAQAAGETFARRAVASQAIGMPLGAGAMYQEAEEAAQAQGRTTTRGEALTSLGLSPLYASLDAVDLNILSGVRNIARREGLRGLIKKVGLGAAVGGATELPQEGIQTAMEQAFRSDLTPQERMRNIVDGALTGAAVGGTLGGVASIRPAREFQGANPSDIRDEDLNSVVNNVLGLTDQTRMFTDAAGRTVQSSLPDDLLATPRESGLTDTDRIVATYRPGQDAPPQIESTTVIQPKQGSLRWAKPYEQASTGPFAAAPTEELQSAAATMEAYLADKDPENFTERDRKIAERYDQVAAELEFRAEPLVNPAESSQGVDTTTVEAVEPAASRSGGAAQQAAPASAPSTIEDILKGISTRKAYSGVANEDELRARLTERLEKGSTAKGDINLAERLGIDLSAPPAANDTSPEPAPANQKGGDQPADAEFQKQWVAQLSKRRGTAIQGLRENLAPTEEAAKRQVYEALGAVTPETKVDGYKGLTELAQELGIQDAEGQLTEEGVRIARTALPTELTAQAAQEAGYTGPEINAFERGARGQRETTVNSIVALRAYNDGQQWATNRSARGAPIPATAGETATQAFIGENTASEQGGRTVSSASIPAAVEDQRWLNLAIDQVYGGKLDPGPTAQLKLMARGGATAQELDEAARYLRSGRGALITPAPARKPFTGEKVTRGLMNTRNAVARKQAIDQERAMAEKRRRGFAALTSTEQSEWIENKARLRAEINEAFESGAINGRDRVGLLVRLTRGDFDVIEDRLSNAQMMQPIISADNPIRTRTRWAEVMRQQQDLIVQVNDRRDEVARADRSGDVEASETARKRLMEAHLELGSHQAEWGDFLDQWDPVLSGRVDEATAVVGDQTLNNARVSRRTFLAGLAATIAAGVAGTAKVGPKAVTLSPATPPRAASARVEQQLKVGSITGALRAIQQTSSNPIYKTIAAKLLRADWSNVRLNVLADPNSPALGLTTLEDDGSSRIDLFEGAGVNEETFLHEAIHAFVQQRWAAISMYTARNRRLLNDAVDRSDATIEGFVDLWRQISAAIERTNPELLQDETFANQLWSDPDEMLAWVLTNERAQTYLRSIDRDGNPVDGRQSLWGSVLKWIADMLGLSYNPQVETALDRIMDAGMSVLDAGASVRGNEFSRAMAAGIARQREQRDRGTLDVEAPMISSISNARYADVVGKITEAADRTSFAGLKGKIREVALGWTSLHGIGEFWGPLFDIKSGNSTTNGVRAYEEALNEKNAISARLSLMMTDARDKFGALQGVNRDSAEKTVRLMTASEFGINPTKPWREQSEKIRDHRNAKNLQKLHREFHDIHRALLARGHADVYQTFRDVNDVLMLSTLSVSLQQQVDIDGHSKGKMPEFSEPPMDAFMREQATREFSPADARAWWMGRLRSQQAALAKYLSEQSGFIAANRDDASTEGLKTTVADLGKRLQGITQTVRQMEDAPYFHLGRYGQFFVGWRVPSTEAMERIGEILSKEGFDGVISEGTDKLKVYMRLESQAAQTRLTEVLRRLERQGLVEPETLKFGKRTKESFPGGFAPQWANQMIANIEADTSLDDDVKEMEINALRALSIDLMPETALARVMTNREGVPGYSPDMMRNFDWRGQVGINALAGAAVAPKVTQAFVDMRGALKDAESGDEASVDQRAGMRDVVDELSRRERERAVWPETRLVDQLSSASTAWFLGFSVSYGFVNMTQLGATLLPELGSKHGFVRASQAIAKAVPTALKIMKEVAKHGYSISLDRAQDAVITQDVLKKVVGKETAEFIMRVVNTGNLDIGGPSRELARAAEGRGDDKLDRVLRYASSIGYYTETASRLIAAIATRRLNPDLSTADAAALAAYNLNETMWNYSRTNQGRQFGKMGIFGTYTPLATKFLQFQAQLTEKLFRESYAAIQGTEAEKAEARRYIKGHLAAMIVLAGSLSLPAMTALAVVFDNLRDLFDDDEEPSNIRNDYRNWLASTLGRDAGEIVARGGFRAFGFDISSRIGEQDLVPFSRFLADRRSFRESIPDLATRTWGAPFSLVRNVLEGGEKLASGDVMGGLSRMLPNGLAGPAKSFRLYEKGYVDAAGNQVPVEQGPLDVLHQLFGFNPSRNAEYQEASNDQRMRRGEIARRRTNLANHIIQALEAGDSSAARAAIEQAQRFDAANPGMAVLPTLGSRITRRARERTLATATRSPLGVNPRDLGAEGLTAYANY